jgi:cytochrome c biogenesis protein CcmG/thiol:disulfide interchange protein DsbE
MSENADTNESESKPTPRSRYLLPGLLAAVLIFSGVLFMGMRNAQTDRPEGKAPDFEMVFFDGYKWQDAPTAKLSDFAGHPVVLNFWASWCVECKVEAELLEDTWQEYRDDGVIFVGVAYIDVEPKSIAYLEEFGITYPNAPDLRSTISSKYDITGVPETFFIDSQGKVVHIQLGPINGPLLTGLINQMLAS